MFYSRRSNNLINNVYERALRVIYNDQYSLLNELLSTKDDSTIHQQNIQTLMKEVYKFMSNFSFPIDSNSFQIRDNIYNLRNFQQLANTKSAFTCIRDEILSRDETRPGMKKILFTHEFYPGMKRVEFHPGMKFNLKENL